MQTMQFNQELQVNPVYVLGWHDVPEMFARELTELIQKFTDNPEVFFEPETLHLGAVLPIDDERDVFLSWKELQDNGLMFAFNWALKERGICILREQGVYLSRDPVPILPQEVDAWIQVLRRHGYQVEGLTA